MSIFIESDGSLWVPDPENFMRRFVLALDPAREEAEGSDAYPYGDPATSVQVTSEELSLILRAGYEYLREEQGDSSA